MNIPLKQGTSYEEITQLIRLGHEIQRKQCGENQRRFRQRQNDWILDMEISTQKLHAEIYALELRRSRVAAAVINANKLWNVAVRYLEVFRGGLAPSSNFTGKPATQFDKQLEFVQTAMTPNVVCYAGYGPEVIMRSWRFSQSFDEVNVEIEKLEEVNNAVVAFTKTSVTFTSQTIRTLFPHLCCTTRGSTSPNWGNKLVGQRIVMRGSTYFEWDGGSSRVSRVMTHSDMMTPMLRILGSLEAVDRVFESARICPNFQMR
ncbi:hypothetical protein PHMEG_0009928 [Phytophthora megakarya]|uniref:Uncharacterized protein n=1 Tax=Phytophthora megakarya TaxID=4795 RepID=A0A225WEZ6_9STRA|nr:hypothetical protein PHMEG_0009928 [Phytophthora megakarya]